MADPYRYPASLVLKNRLGIRSGERLQAFENAMTAQRIAAGLPVIPLSIGGYRALHFYLFQDVYDWAGELRRVDIAKPGALFCRFEFIERELSKRFVLIQEDDWRDVSTKGSFAPRAAEHLSELNAIHPFREGNGRTLRAFLEVLGDHAGVPMAIERTDPALWLAASRQSFTTGETGLFEAIVDHCRIVPDS